MHVLYLTLDIIDSSGMIYYLTSEEPDQLAGVLTLGHNVESLMIIPPKSADYTIAGICDTSCIDTVSETRFNLAHEVCRGAL